MAMQLSPSGWPWMKGCPVSIVDKPIPPVHDQDDRPSLHELFAQHRAQIDHVAEELASHPLFETSKHDDLWIVRFLLSHKKNIKNSLKAAKYTLEFRSEHKLDEKDIRYSPMGPDIPSEPFQRFLKYCQEDTFRFVVPDLRQGVIGFINLGGIDQQGAVKNVDEADWLPTFLYVSEWSHQWVDYLSRTTGRLTSSIRVVDIGNVKLSKMSIESGKRDGNAMKAMEDCYPQLLKALLICNANSWFLAIWRVVRVLFPKRVVEKTDFLDPKKNTKDLARLLKYIAIEHLPTRHGGNNEMWPMDMPPPVIKRDC